MVGKFVLVAFLYVFLTQVQGNELEMAKKNALNQLTGFFLTGQKRMEAAVGEIDNHLSSIESKTANFIAKSEDIRNRIHYSLRNMAFEMEEKASEANKPEFVFECIKKNEKNADSQINNVTNKLKTDLERLQNNKVEDIKTDTKPLYELQTALIVRRERALKTIENSDAVTWINITIKTSTKWLDKLYADLRRILNQVATTSGDFGRDANKYFTNTNRQTSIIQYSTMKNFKTCVYKTEYIYEEY